ncbi:MAG: hypothetical protein IPO74_04165 [Thermomonas sp.]|nr:hypothetical protein [Thermomonas sp.]
MEASDRHSIFIGNAASPRKGGHVMLEALALLRREYPQVRLVIAGEKLDAKSRGLRRSIGYPAYLGRQAAGTGSGRARGFHRLA